MTLLPLFLSFDQVACSLITTIYWHKVQKYFDLPFWGKQTPPPCPLDEESGSGSSSGEGSGSGEESGSGEGSGFRSRSRSRSKCPYDPNLRADEAVNGRDFPYPDWAPPAWAFVPYLDEDRNGKVSIQEFYDVKFVHILRKIFDGLDSNGDGVVTKNEAHLRSFLRVAPVRSFSKELFDLMDVNKDGFVSVEDPDPVEWRKEWRSSICSILPYSMRDACKSLMETYYKTLVDK